MTTLIHEPGYQPLNNNITSMSPTLDSLQRMFLKAADTTTQLPEVLDDDEAKTIAYYWLRQTLGVLEYERDKNTQLENELVAIQARTCEVESELVQLRREVERLTTELTRVASERDKFLVEKGLYQQQLGSSSTDPNNNASTSPGPLTNNLEQVISQYSDLRVQNSQLQLSVCSLEGELATTKVRLATLMEREETLQSRVRELGGLTALKAEDCRDSNFRADTYQILECTPPSRRSKPATFGSVKISPRLDIPLESARSGCSSKGWGGWLMGSRHGRSGSLLFTKGISAAPLSCRTSEERMPTGARAEEEAQFGRVEDLGGSSMVGSLLRSTSVEGGSHSSSPPAPGESASRNVLFNSARMDEHQPTKIVSSSKFPQVAIPGVSNRMNHKDHKSPRNNCVSSDREQTSEDNEIGYQDSLTPPPSTCWTGNRPKGRSRKTVSRPDTLLQRILRSPRKCAPTISLKSTTTAKHPMAEFHGNISPCHPTDGASRGILERSLSSRQMAGREFAGSLLLPGITRSSHTRPPMQRKTSVPEPWMGSPLPRYSKPGAEDPRNHSASWTRSNRVTSRVSAWSFDDM